MDNGTPYNRQNQTLDQLPQKKPIKKIIGIALLLALIIFAIIPFLITAVVVLFFSFSH